MPKRPCAIALTPDDANILIADKFGDVYAIPLLGQIKETAEHATLNEGDPNANAKRFVPSASTLTVHTKKNRRALEQQQKLQHHRPEKDSLKFDHKLIIGHVSLLTDIACISLPRGALNAREYIFTSDRDEHIRISRGLPQAHIIEGYCLGHSEFITKIGIPSSKPNRLLSAGGDGFLLLWDWTTCTVLQKFDLKEKVEEIIAKYNINFQAGDGEAGKDRNGNRAANMALAVSHLHLLTKSSHHLLEANEQGSTEIIIAFERLPLLIFLLLDNDSRLKFRGHFSTAGNITDITSFTSFTTNTVIIYSMDTLHRPGTSKLLQEEDDDGTLTSSVAGLLYGLRPGAFRGPEGPEARMLSTMNKCAEDHPFVWQTNAAKGKSMTEMLYSLESLRKRRDGHDDDGNDAE